MNGIEQMIVSTVPGRSRKVVSGEMMLGAMVTMISSLPRDRGDVADGEAERGEIARGDDFPPLRGVSALMIELERSMTYEGGKLIH